MEKIAQDTVGGSSCRAVDAQERACLGIAHLHLWQRRQGKAANYRVLPIEAMKKWHADKPDLFITKHRDRPGLDIPDGGNIPCRRDPANTAFR